MKSNANRAVELLQLVLQVLETGQLEEESGKSDKPEKKSDIGKNQAVNEYPNSPLRFRGRAK